tara:strand:- start:83 stop:301 length:219 start_codon:yes stop_codon:yes gene_type:complete
MVIYLYGLLILRRYQNPPQSLKTSSEHANLNAKTHNGSLGVFLNLRFIDLFDCGTLRGFRLRLTTPPLICNK